MNDFERTLSQYWKEFPSEKWSFLGSPEDAKNIPSEHKDQIHFLTEEGRQFLENWIVSSKMQEDVDLWRDNTMVFNPNYFKKVEKFQLYQGSEKHVKKWLYQRGIPFSKYVFIDPWVGDQGVMLTWKMVIKYSERLFFAHDLLIVDSSLDWGLFYYHSDMLYFGHDIHFDREVNYKKVTDLNCHIQEWNEKAKKS
ncbi:MAG: hypothetical protein AAGI23_00860 [Bacteroidota bacterium]